MIKMSILRIIYSLAVVA